MPQPRESDSTARRAVQERISEVRKHEAGVLRSDPDSIHDMRVATRRLRAALKMFGVRDSGLKQLQDALGAVRDVQLQVDWLANRGDARSVALLRERLLGELNSLAEALHQEVAHWRTITLPRLRRNVFKARSPRRSKSRRSLARHVARVGSSCSDFKKSQRATVAHRLRIDAKKLRYVAELLTEIGEPLVKRLIPLQRRLGDLHDTDVRIELLDREHLGKLAARERVRRRTLVKRVETQVARWRKLL